MSNHTPEPWKYTERIKNGNAYGMIVGADGSVVASNEEHYPEAVTEENQRHIVACVNACAGVGTEKLEGEASNLREWHEQMRIDAIDRAARNLDLKDQLTTVTAQRDELLQAMRQIAFATAPEPDDGSEHENAYSLAMGAIEKCGVQP